MESQPQNPEFMKNLENFHPYFVDLSTIISHPMFYETRIIASYLSTSKCRQLQFTHCLLEGKAYMFLSPADFFKKINYSGKLFQEYP